MNESNVNLSAPLATLVHEHVTLRADMNDFYETIEEIEIASARHSF